MSRSCVTCGEPLQLVPGLGLVGNGGVCRNEFDPTCAGLDNEGQHIYPGALGAASDRSTLPGQRAES